MLRVSCKVAYKEAAQARLGLHLSKIHIIGNHMSRLIMSLHEGATNFFSWLDTNLATRGEVCLLCINGFVT